jgi:hypothetical protein
METQQPDVLMSGAGGRQWFGVDMNENVDLTEQGLLKVMLERDVLRADVERLTRLLAKAERQLAARARSCRLYGCHFERAPQAGSAEHLGRPSCPSRPGGPDRLGSVGFFPYINP